MKTAVLMWSGGVLALTVAACTAPEPTMPDATTGQAVYGAYCADCHGASGMGDGPAAGAGDARPANLTTIAKRNGGTFPKAQVMSLVDGYTRGEKDRPGMPSFGDLLNSPLVPFDSGDGIQTPTPSDLVALVSYLETLQQP